jgi:hypothetical protein
MLPKTTEVAHVARLVVDIAAGMHCGGAGHRGDDRASPCRPTHGCVSLVLKRRYRTRNILRHFGLHYCRLRHRDWIALQCRSWVTNGRHRRRLTRPNFPQYLPRRCINWATGMGQQRTFDPCASKQNPGARPGIWIGIRRRKSVLGDRWPIKLVADARHYVSVPGAGN